MKKVLILMIIIALFLTACSNEPISGGDSDEYGCKSSIGEIWCPSTEKCQKVWEDYCEEYKEQYKGDELETETEEINSEDIQDAQVKEIIDLTEYPIQLTFEKSENSVKLSWTKPSEEFEFVSYKVSRSVTDSNPVYPGNTLRKTIVNIDELEYVDTLPEEGISYYVVTALGPFNEKIHSNPVMVEFPNSKETPDQDIKIIATNTDKGVLLNWDKYEGDFLFYKIVWTTDHKNPKYPDDSTIATIAYVNETEYLHLIPEPGLNYYAVTVVRPNKSRFTSESASVNI